MNEVKVSLFASAVRPWLWGELFESLQQNELEFEVVFAGPVEDDEIKNKLGCDWPYWFRYVRTENIKPAQCYEVARRYCQGELVNWTADDCVYSAGLLDDVYSFWKKLDNPKAIVSVKTNEDETNNDLDDHRFFGKNKNTPLMAPLGFLGSAWLTLLGGLDRRYVAGQYENDVVMRSNQFGGIVVKFESGVVSISHKKKHGNTTKFWDGYGHDRTVLENSWVVGGYQPVPGIALDLTNKVAFYPIPNREVSLSQLDEFERYEDTDLLVKSQSFKGEWV